MYMLHIYYFINKFLYKIVNFICKNTHLFFIFTTRDSKSLRLKIDLLDIYLLIYRYTNICTTNRDSYKSRAKVLFQNRVELKHW